MSPTVLHVPLSTCRVIVAVLNSFHFDVRAAAPGLAVGPSGSEPSTAEVMDPEGGTVEEGNMKDAEELGQNAGLNGDDGEEEGSPGSADTAQKIHDSICMTVLPELRECLVKQVSSTFLYMLHAWQCLRLF